MLRVPPDLARGAGGFAIGLALLAGAPQQADARDTDSRFVVPSLAGGGFTVGMGTMLDRRFYSVIRQRYDFSCGSAALATLMRYHYGIPVDEAAAFSGMWERGDQDAIRASGFSLLDMKRYLAAHALETQGFRVTLDQIARTGVPGIALTVTRGYRHFVVIKGVTAQHVLVGDPSRGLQRYPRAQFEKVWDGLFFVITSAREVGQASFNRPAQWASVAYAPVKSGQSRPIAALVGRVPVAAPYVGEL